MFFQGPRLRTSPGLNSLLNAAAMALSWLLPVLPIDATGPASAESLGVADSEVLGPLFAVVHQGTGVVTLTVPGPQSHVQRVQGQVAAYRDGANVRQ